MKKFRKNIIVALLGVLFAIPFSGCDKVDELIDDTTSECDAKENKLTTQKRKFKMSCIVKYKNGELAGGVTVNMEIFKTYCEGNITGQFFATPSVTNQYGEYDCPAEHGYNYNNKKDLVTCIFFIDNVPYNFLYPWHFVDDWGEGLQNVECEIKLPYDAP